MLKEIKETAKLYKIKKTIAEHNKMGYKRMPIAVTAEEAQLLALRGYFIFRINVIGSYKVFMIDWSIRSSLGKKETPCSK